MPDSIQQLADSLSELRRFWERPDRKRRFLAELGEPIEFGVLRALIAVDRHRDGSPGRSGPGVSDVAATLSIDTSTASRLLDQAVGVGYIVRVPEPDDRRRTHLEVTDEGRRVLDRANAIRHRWLTEITAGWSAGEVERLAELLTRFVADATSDSPEGA